MPIQYMRKYLNLAVKVLLPILAHELFQDKCFPMFLSIKYLNMLEFHKG